VNPPFPAVFMLEAFNSNNDVTTVTADTTYKAGPLSLGPTGSYTFRAHNSYDPTSFQFVPAKTKWSAGGVLQYAVTNQVSLTARVERIWVTVDSSPDKINPILGLAAGTATPELRTDAWLASIGGTVQF
jgi:hypothetical protein